MNDKIRQLQKNCNEWHTEATALLDKPEPTGEEQAKGLKLLGDIKAAKGQIAAEFKRLEAVGELGDLGREMQEPEAGFKHSGKPTGSAATVHGFKDAGQTVIDSYGTVLEDIGPGVFGSEAKYQHVQGRDYKRSFVKMVRQKGSFRGFHGAELKTIQEGLDDQGGAFVPADMLMRIVMRKPTPTRIAGMCTNITTGRDRVIMPRIQYSADDLYTTAFRASWDGEIPPGPDVIGVNDSGLTGNIEIPVFTAMMSAPVTNDMVEDSAYPIMQWLEDQLRVTVDLLKDNMAINGTGRGQPLGFLANPGGLGQPAVVPTGTAAKVFADDLLNVSNLLPEQYDENSNWAFNKTNAYNGFRKLKDAGGRYLFNQGYQDSGLSNGRPKDLAGYPFAWSGFMPNLGTAANVSAANADGSVTGTSGAYPAAFGDFLGHYIVNRLGITLQVLRETKAKQNQIEIVARVRFGGKPVEPWRLRILQVA